MYIIYDDLHAEIISEKLDSFEAAKAELHRIFDIPFGEKPNTPPCTGWQQCQRDYHIVEYDDTQAPWKLLSDTRALELSKTVIKWHCK
jgi:hypothetical protein